MTRSSVVSYTKPNSLRLRFAFVLSLYCILWFDTNSVFDFMELFLISFYGLALIRWATHKHNWYGKCDMSTMTRRVLFFKRWIMRWFVLVCSVCIAACRNPWVWLCNDAGSNVVCTTAQSGRINESNCGDVCIVYTKSNQVISIGYRSLTSLQVSPKSKTLSFFWLTERSCEIFWIPIWLLLVLRCIRPIVTSAFFRSILSTIQYKSFRLPAS